MFLGIHITKDLSCTNNTTTLVKKAQQCLYFLMQLKKLSMAPWVLSKYYHCTIESVLTRFIMA
jgi:hypothetical protein